MSYPPSTSRCRVVSLRGSKVRFSCNFYTRKICNRIEVLCRIPVSSVFVSSFWRCRFSNSSDNWTPPLGLFGFFLLILGFFLLAWIASESVWKVDSKLSILLVQYLLVRQHLQTEDCQSHPYRDLTLIRYPSRSKECCCYPPDISLVWSTRFLCRFGGR